MLIADYKTNRPAPQDLAETRSRHPGYVQQLALYRAVLMRLYPEPAGARRSAVDGVPGLHGNPRRKRWMQALAILTRRVMPP